MDIIEYNESYGEIKFPEGFKEKLIGKPIEEQMELYRISESICFTNLSYGEITSQHITKNTYKLDEYKNLRSLIVKDGLLVGVAIPSWSDKTSVDFCLPYQRVCTYSACDDDGAGESDRDDYISLICIED